jgi:spore maturation protein CgeB
MIKIDHEIYNHWTVGDYFDWVLLHYGHEFDEFGFNGEDKNIVLSIEPNTENHKIHYTVDNHRLKDEQGYISRWKNVELLFYTQPTLRYLFDNLNKNSHCIPLAAQPELHRPYDFEKIYDVGIIMQADGKRGKFVNNVMGKSGLKWLNTSAIHSPWEYSWALSHCSVLFNYSRNGEINMRFFEAMSIGALVTDRVQGAKFFAEEGVHYVGYNREDEDGAVAVLIDLLKDKDRIERISHDSRQLIVKKHTYRHRLKEIFKIFKEANI